MLKTAITFLCLFATSLFGQASPYKVVEVDPFRTVYIRGEISGGTLDVLSKIVNLADGLGGDIHMVINSPGGSVVAGGHVLSAMQIAKSRGHRIVCYVPMLAASMGFQILIHCDKRYTLKNAALLWHPMTMYSNYGMSSEDLLYNHRRIRAWEKPFVQDLINALKISRKEFFYHYYHETLWLGFEFHKLAPGFITVVDDIRNVPELFSM